MRNLLRLIVKNYFVLLFLLLEGVGIIMIFQFNPFQKSFIVNLSRVINTNFSIKVGNVRDYLYLKEENEGLNNQNTLLINQLQHLSKTVYLSVPDSGMVDTLGVYGNRRFEFIPAEIIRNSVNKQYNYLTLNKGLSDGIGPDMAVISSNGIVGMILHSSEHFSVIQPLLNRNSRIGAKIKGEDYFGILEWNGRSINEIQLKEIPIHVQINIGDTIVTSGYSSIFPKGLSIGSINSFERSEGNFYDIKVNLFVNYHTLNHVMIIKNLYQEEQKELEQIQNL